MTLVVLGLEVPNVSRETTVSDLYQLLIADWQRFEDYALSFLRHWADLKFAPA